MYTLNGKLGMVVPCTDPIFTASTCYAIRISKRMGGKAAGTLMQNVCSIDPMSFQVCTVVCAVSAGGSNKPKPPNINNHQPPTTNHPQSTRKHPSIHKMKHHILQLRLKFHCAFLRSFCSLNFTPRTFSLRYMQLLKKVWTFKGVTNYLC